MPCISSCPACHRDLTVADYADSERRLRCPLCSAEFSAAEILADGVPFPPAAIDIEAERAAAPETPAAQEESLASQAAVAPGESAEVAESHEPAAAESESEASGDADLEQEEAAAEPGYSVRSVPRRKTKTSAIGMLGHVIGMALGGVLGLAIGYYVLLWIGGPQADFLELRAKLPAWMLPGKRAKRERPDARRGETDDHSHERSLADLLEEPDAKPEESGDVSKVAFEAPQSAAATSDSLAAPGNAAFAENFSLGGAAGQDGQGLLNETAPDGFGDTRPKDSEAAVGPRGFSAYSADDLGLALAKAAAAIGCEHCHATGYILRQAPGGAQRDPAAEPQRSRCPHCHGKPIRGLTTEAFDRLCILADAVTFAQLAPDEAERDRLREQLMAALTRVADDRGKTQIIGRLAGARLDDSQRQTNGIILAGTVQSVAAEGPLYRIQIVLFGQPRTVVVYSRQAPQPGFSPADRVLILGSIVDSPSENLAGYQGRLTQVVWGGLPLKLAPAAP